MARVTRFTIAATAPLSTFGVTKEGWRNIYPHFPQYTHKQVTNKFDALKQKYKEWHDAQSPSGLGRDTATGGIAAEPEYWQTQYGLPNDPDDCTEPVVGLLLLILLLLSSLLLC